MKPRSVKYPLFEDYAEQGAAHPLLSGGYRVRGQAAIRSDIPLVSIITVTFNAGKTLLRTLQSVRTQTYQNIEHIIIDGGSTDGTLDLIRAHEDSIAYWRSEPDHGIYDAFNKGVVLSTGEFIGILNADDYYEPEQIEKAISTLVRTGAPFVHGDIIMHGWQGQDVFLRGDPEYAAKIRSGMPALFQVTVLCKKDVFKHCGLFLTKYRIAGDYEWFLRVAKRGSVGVYDPRIRAHMQAGGISTSRQRRSILEVGHISWQHGLTLAETVRLTAPRVLFPNGHQQIIARVARASELVQRPLRLFKKAAHAVASRYRDLFHRSATTPLLEAFLDARQRCATISPLGLEWLYHLALRSRTYSIQASQGPEVSAARALFQGGGAREVSPEIPGNILLVDAAQADRVMLHREIRRRTVLVINNGRPPLRADDIPHLDLGGIVAFGPYVEQQFPDKRG